MIAIDRNEKANWHSIGVSLITFLVMSGGLDAKENESKWTSAKAIDFKREIRPILSNRCFACHGPDEEKIESGLRLDLRDHALQPADSGSVAIVPGNASESELIKRISSLDDSQRMPPPHFGAPLTDEEQKKIGQWIDQGAPYTKHWSYEPIVVNPVPEEGISDWPNWQFSVVDRWLLHSLVQKGWQPTHTADKRTLLRRVTVDLTGLPPSPEELDSFLNDDSEDAYRKVVDRLLASPAFGENWARKWLDMARYADSAGYADDPQRTIWAYRDWVIKAINHGIPFDEFTKLQLAADLIPNGTDEDLIATAFHRNTLTNNEGGTNDEEFRNVAIVDRVNTTMSVWMGITMGCAQCHSHKYDPISQKEYFELFAIFNQSQDADRSDESPVLAVLTDSQKDEIQRLEKEIREKKYALSRPEPTLLLDQQHWVESTNQPIDWTGIQIEEVTSSNHVRASYQNEDAIELDYDSVPDRDDITLSWSLDTSSDTPSADLSNWTGFQITAIPRHLQSGKHSKIGNGNFVLTDVSLTASPVDFEQPDVRFIRIELPGTERILSLAEVQVFQGNENVATRGKATQSSVAYEGIPSRAIDGNTSGKYEENSTTHSQTEKDPWWELELDQAQKVDKLVLWNRTGGGLLERLSGAVVTLYDSERNAVFQSTIQKAETQQSIAVTPQFQFHWIAATSDYHQPNFDASLTIDRDPKSGWAIGGDLDSTHQLQLIVDRSSPLPDWVTNAKRIKLRLRLSFQSPHAQHILQSLRLQSSSASNMRDWYTLPSSVQSVVRHSKRSEADEQLLHQYYVERVAPERNSLRTQIAELEMHRNEIKPATTVPIMRELEPGKHRETFVQLRGNYRVHGERVSSGLPSAFPKLKRPEKVDKEHQESATDLTRLDLARWLVQSDNPLTPRVIANRYWEILFGVGIVRTSEEFGSQGDLPTHPELLDYLAAELIESHWDTKSLVRTLVLSQAYQQSSAVTHERFEEDPENTYVSRGPRFRSSAEQIRDSALAVAGLLSHNMYGPPTRPPQPAMGLSAAFGSKTDWETSSGANRYRRALYTQWRRSNPYPSMATFDAPNREVCVLKRDRTNTPLQALVTLNDPAFVEAAQGLARRILLYELPSATEQERIERAYELVLARLPLQRESQAIEALIHSMEMEFRLSPKGASQIATDPIGPIPIDSAPQTDEFVAKLAAWTSACNVLLNLDEFLMKP